MFAKHWCFITMHLTELFKCIFTIKGFLRFDFLQESILFWYQLLIYCLFMLVWMQLFYSFEETFYSITKPKHSICCTLISFVSFESDKKTEFKQYSLVCFIFRFLWKTTAYFLYYSASGISTLLVVTHIHTCHMYSFKNNFWYLFFVIC